MKDWSNITFKDIYSGKTAGKLEKCIGAPRCYTPHTWKNKKRFKKSNFFEIKDEYRYCTYKNISLGNYFYFILGKKTNLKRPMTKYYSLYIHYNFFFAQVTIKVNF
jgi:hypothetical protein